MFRPRSESESEDEEVPLMTRADNSVRTTDDTAETSIDDVTAPLSTGEERKVSEPLWKSAAMLIPY